MEGCEDTGWTGGHVSVGSGLMRTGSDGMEVR